MQIGVVGNDTRATPQALKTAYEVGKEIGKRKHILICGGRGGVMERASKGAEEEGGITVGILPSADGSDANPHLTVKIKTGMGFGRNTIVALSSDVLIVIGGGSGTLCELAYAWQAGKPIIAMKGTGGYADEYAGKRVDDKRKDSILCAKTPKEALDLAQKAVFHL
jgi:uncharacterized protein (TIGR00725 family)